METDIWRGSLLPLNEIEDKLGDLWPLHEDTAGWRFIALDVVPESQCDLDNEASNPLEQDDNNGNLGDDTGITDTPLGLRRIQKSAFAEELVLSEADLMAFSF